MKDLNEDGSCDLGFLVTIDKYGDFYCRPEGTQDRNDDGTCPLGFKGSPVDNRFCIPETEEEGDDTDGDGKPDSEDGCPDGTTWDVTEKRCVMTIDITAPKGHKPATLVDICKQDAKLLTPSTIAYCKANTPEQKDKDATYIQQQLTALGKYFTDGTKSLVEDPSSLDVKVGELYTGIFKPFEALLSERPQCPILQDVDLPTVDFFDHQIDFKKMFPKEGLVLPCDMLELMRIMFLLTVIYFGFRLVFKALFGV